MNEDCGSHVQPAERCRSPLQSVLNDEEGLEPRSERLRVRASAPGGERDADCQQSADGGRLPESHYCLSDRRSSS